jgi:hypothetical protein
VPSIFPAYAGAGLGCRSSISRRIFRNSFFGTAPSVNWNVTYRPWRATLAPILISFSGKAVSDQCSTYLGDANFRLWLRVLKKSEPTDFVQLSFL